MSFGSKGITKILQQGTIRQASFVGSSEGMKGVILADANLPKADYDGLWILLIFFGCSISSYHSLSTVWQLLLAKLLLDILYYKPSLISIRLISCGCNKYPQPILLLFVAGVVCWFWFPSEIALSSESLIYTFVSKPQALSESVVVAWWLLLCLRFERISASALFASTFCCFLFAAVAVSFS